MQEEVEGSNWAACQHNCHISDKHKHSTHSVKANCPTHTDLQARAEGLYFSPRHFNVHIDISGEVKLRKSATDFLD